MESNNSKVCSVGVNNFEDALSPRTAQILHGLLRGQSEKQLGKQLQISRHTVHVYVKRLYVRFRVNSRGELLARWISPGAFIPLKGGDVPRKARTRDKNAKLRSLIGQRKALLNELARLDQKIAAKQEDLSTSIRDIVKRRFRRPED